MSLRRDVHSALDHISPSPRGLSERVVMTVLAQGASRRRKGKLILRLRAPLSLVAVFVLIALVAAVFIGGRLMQDWNSFHTPVPAGGQQLSPLAQLEARALHLPTYKSAAQCITGPLGTDNALGSGVLHLSGSAVEIPTPWGFYYHDLLLADRAVEGPILVRARDLITKERIVFIGDHASGPAIGTDTVAGQTVQQLTELVISEPGHDLAWAYEAGSPKDTSRCDGWQIDTPKSTEVIVIGY